MVVPLFTQHLRWFVDGLAVLVISSTEFQGRFIPPSSASSELDGGVRFGTGLQFRPFEVLSVGLRLSVTSAFDDFDSDGGRGWLVDFDSEQGHFDASVGVTFYF